MNPDTFEILSLSLSKWDVVFELGFRCTSEHIRRQSQIMWRCWRNAYKLSEDRSCWPLHSWRVIPSLWLSFGYVHQRQSHARSKLTVIQQMCSHSFFAGGLILDTSSVRVLTVMMKERVKASSSCSSNSSEKEPHTFTTKLSWEVF